MKFLSAMFAEHSGKPSASRALSAFVCACVVGAWTFVSIKKLELQALSAEQVAMVLGSMGLKAWQRGKEVSADGHHGAPAPNQIIQAKGSQDAPR